MLTNQGSWPDSGQILRHQYGISVVEVQTFLLAKCSKQRGERWNGYIYSQTSLPPCLICITHNLYKPVTLVLGLTPALAGELVDLPRPRPLDFFFTSVSLKSLSSWSSLSLSASLNSSLSSKSLSLLFNDLNKKRKSFLINLFNKLVGFVFTIQTTWCSPRKFAFLFIMHTYARGCTYIRRHLKETVLWGTNTYMKWENKTYKLKRSFTTILESCVLYALSTTIYFILLSWIFF